MSSLLSSLTGAAESKLLHAWQARLTGNLTLQGEKEAASIHFWNKPEDTISWTWTGAEPGRYRVEINYSLHPNMQGGKISLIAGEQRIVAPAETTGAWTEFRTFPLGVLSVEKGGDLSVVLQAAQMPSPASPAMPDVVWLSLTPTDAPATSESVRPSTEFKGKALFDGTTLTGWEGDLRYFRIADEAIVAGNLQEPIPQNVFLCTTREYGDFELRFQARVWKGRANGGVQFRSHRVKDSTEMSGYQADCTPSLWGGVYDEGRRGAFLGVRLNAEETVKVVKPADWNQCVIRCEGPRVRVWVNDVLTLDYTEADTAIPRSGLIGLQIHSGGPAEVAYKDIQIQEFPASN
ncbi:MAG TPA: DUF1080 domain-containing protein [Chthoniobacteraceae bacterium]|jgi:hypothetical protein